MLSFNDIKKNDKIYLYAGDIKQWNTILITTYLAHGRH